MILGIPGREGTVEDVLTGDRRKVGGRRHQRERERSSTSKFPEVRLCVNIRNCSGISLITLFGKITGHRTMTDANGVSSSFRSQLVSAGADTWVQSAFSVDARHCMCGGAVLCVVADRQSLSVRQPLATAMRTNELRLPTRFLRLRLQNPA